MKPKYRRLTECVRDNGFLTHAVVSNAFLVVHENVHSEHSDLNLLLLISI